MIHLIYILAVVMSSYLWHEVGFINGSSYQKFVDNSKLQDCHRIIANE